jgi:hypothetical protein
MTSIVFYVEPRNAILIKYHSLFSEKEVKILAEKSMKRYTTIAVNGPFLSAIIPHGTLQIAELRIISIRPRLMR